MPENGDGDISRDIERCLEAARVSRSATSSQSLLVMRCSLIIGFQKKCLKQEQNFVQEIWNTLIAKCTDGYITNIMHFLELFRKMNIYSLLKVFK
ncbi:hypothetical protein NQ314_009239 [Rhamnusium bicolor]|uniref:Uncharacterized protein n=1 Tax=Rhamnusium bicolor TaxID=1586634 RepID=A0AAV8Y1U1_9CUCU|nr:hypothetical protein NQ314_009239 [Rhamnusium bicolor]